MLKIDSHTHPFQTDRSSPAGLCLYAENAIARGFSGIVFTEHAPMGIPVSRHYLNESELENYLLWAEECKKKYSGKIEISIGLECDYLPENMDYLVRLLDRCKVSYAGGSLHLHADFWKDRIAGMDPASRTRFALGRTLDMVNTGIFHTVCHLDFFRWHQPEYHPEQFEDEYRAIFEAMVRHDMALEWNSSGLLKDFASGLPCELVWKWSLDYPLRRVFGSDSHKTELVGFQWETYEQLIENFQKYEEKSVCMKNSAV